MFRLRDRTRHSGTRWAVAATLAMFLLGTNYCLVDAFAGALGHHAQSPCHAVPARTSGGAPCCHPQAPTPGHGNPVPSGALPCCLTYVPASGPQLDKIDSATFTPLADALEVSPERINAAGARQGHNKGQDPPPPQSRPSAPFRGRAPPLA